MKENEIPIACAINGNYGLPLIVMLISLTAHLRESSRAVLYLVHRRLPLDLLRAIGRLVDLRPVELSATQLAIVPHDPRFPPEAAAPLLLADLLPQGLERVLFLDADILVLDDITELWETDTRSAALAAVPDSAIPRCGSPRGVKGCGERGIPPDAVYFNAGVMLMDLQRWKERDVTGRALLYLRKTAGAVDFLHQEALNAQLWNDWMPLDPRWNLLASLAGRPHRRQPWNATEGWRRPGIVHYSGRSKPWKHKTGGPFAAQYEHFLREAEGVVRRPQPGLRDHLLGIYDRYLRRYFYGIEHELWKQRIL